MTKWGALSGIVLGGLTVITWIALGLSNYMYEMIPGFSLSLISTVFVSLVTESPHESVNNDFYDMEKALASIE